MPSDMIKTPNPSDEEVQDAFQTISGLPGPSDQLGTRLQKLAELIAKSGPLPREPLLLWEESVNSTRHVVVGNELVVGRQPGPGGLRLADDKTLGRRHFVVRKTGEDYIVEDLKSRNTTVVNQVENKIQHYVLRDGDLIFAGGHLFFFLQRGV